jgi:hypothetical protein
MLLKNKTKTAFREIGGFFVSFFKELIQLSTAIFIVLKKKRKGFPLLSGLELSFSKTIFIPLQSQFSFVFHYQIHQPQ